MFNFKQITTTTTTTTTMSFNKLFFRTTQVGRYQKDKPLWILLNQEMMGWQWHQLDHMQVICTSLQTDNHASTLSLKFLQARCSSCCPNNSVKALKANYYYRNPTLGTHCKNYLNVLRIFRITLHKVQNILITFRHQCPISELLRTHGNPGPCEWVS